jgi:hypothetical protein
MATLLDWLRARRHAAGVRPCAAGEQRRWRQLARELRFEAEAPEAGADEVRWVMALSGDSLG